MYHIFFLYQFVSINFRKKEHSYIDPQFTSDFDIFDLISVTAASWLDWYVGGYCEGLCSFPKFGYGCQQRFSVENSIVTFLLDAIMNKIASFQNEKKEILRIASYIIKSLYPFF